MGLIKKLRKAKKEAPPNEKPAVVKTHLRDMIIVPEMIGSVVGIYNGKVCLYCGLSSGASAEHLCSPGFQLGRNQTRDGRSLSWGILRLVQARQARSPWCSSLSSHISFLN